MKTLIYVCLFLLLTPFQSSITTMNQQIAEMWLVFEKRFKSPDLEILEQLFLDCLARKNKQTELTIRNNLFKNFHTNNPEWYHDENKFGLFKRLLTKNMDLAIKNKEGLTPLHSAVEAHNHAVVDLLLQHGTEITHLPDGTSPLEKAKSICPNLSLNIDKLMELKENNIEAFRDMHKTDCEKSSIIVCLLEKINQNNQN